MGEPATTTPLQFPFPGEHPQQHLAKEYLDKLHDAISARKLQAIVRGELPLRVQAIRNWPDELTAVPDDVASTMDAAALYKAQADAARRAKDNEANDQTIKVAVLEDKTNLATLITEGMVNTAPLLRENLRTASRIGTSDYFDGEHTYKLLLKYLRELATENVDGDYYQKAEEAMRDPKNRLPAGCSATQFAVRVRNFTSKINPNLERPYQGKGIGTFIINLMPTAYAEAGERIEETLKAAGKLHDPVAVGNACLRIVHKRTKASIATTNAFACAPCDENLPPSDGDATVNKTLGDALQALQAAALAVGGGGPRRGRVDEQPGGFRGWKPDFAKHKFCPRCPNHEAPGCYSDPRITPTMSDRALGNHAYYDRIAKRRAEAATALGITAKPMPPKKAKNAEPCFPCRHAKNRRQHTDARSRWRRRLVRRPGRLDRRQHVRRPQLRQHRWHGRERRQTRCRHRRT